MDRLGQQISRSISYLAASPWVRNRRCYYFLFTFISIIFLLLVKVFSDREAVKTMGKVFKNLVEPAAIFLTFTIGTLVNRRSRRLRRYCACVPHSPRCTAARSESYVRRNRPDTVRFEGNLMSRFLNYFPFLIEIWYWLLTYWIYQVARAYSAYLIRGKQRVYEHAQSHALSILYFEQALGFAFEFDFQQYIMSSHPLLMTILSYVYYSHISIGVMFITYSYTFMHTPIFQKIRRTIAMDNVISFLILTLYRCMPPRLLPEEYGYIDVLHKSRLGNAWTINRFQLTIAAVPSMHFGTSLLVGTMLWRFAPHKALSWIAPLWPAAMFITIIVTANHFVLDAVIGACIPLLGWKYNTHLLRLRTLEEWGFWLCRTKKPEDKACCVVEDVVFEKMMIWSASDDPKNGKMSPIDAGV